MFVNNVTSLLIQLDFICIVSTAYVSVWLDHMHEVDRQRRGLAWDLTPRGWGEGGGRTDSCSLVPHSIPSSCLEIIEAYFWSESKICNRLERKEGGGLCTAINITKH